MTLIDVENAIQASLRGGDRQRGSLEVLQPAEEEQHAAWLGELHSVSDGLYPANEHGSQRFWGFDQAQQKIWKVALLPPKVDAIKSAPLRRDLEWRLRRLCLELVHVKNELLRHPGIDNQTAFVIAADNVRQAASDLADEMRNS